MKKITLEEAITLARKIEADTYRCIMDSYSEEPEDLNIAILETSCRAASIAVMKAFDYLGLIG